MRPLASGGAAVRLVLAANVAILLDGAAVPQVVAAPGAVALHHATPVSPMPAGADTAGKTGIVAPPGTVTAPNLEQLRTWVDAGRWAQARQGLLVLVESARTSHDRRTEAEASWLLGSCLQCMGLFSPAAEAHRSALVLARELGDQALANRAQAGIGLAVVNEGQGGPVVDTLRALVETARRERNDGLAAEAWTALAMYELTHVDPRRALASYDSALVHARRAAVPRLEARVLADLGLAFARSGEPDSALVYVEAALQLAARSGAQGEAVATLVRLGQLHSNGERFSAAITTLREALRQATALGFPRAVANVHSSLGMLHARLGENEEALLELTEAARMARQMQNPRFEAGMHRWIAGVLASQGKLEEAEARLAESWRLQQSFHYPYLRLWTLADRAGLHLRRRNVVAAEADLAAAFALAQEAGEQSALAELACMLAHVCNERGAPVRALAWSDSALAVVKATGQEPQRRDALFERGRAWVALGDPGAAAGAFATAIQNAEAVRTHLGGEELRIAFQQQVHELYFQRARTLCALAWQLPVRGSTGAHVDSFLAEAYQVAERAHGRALLEVLGGTIPQQAPEAPRALRERQASLRRQMEKTQAILSWTVSQERADPARIDSLRRDLGAVLQELRDTEQEIAARAPLYGDLTGLRPPLRAAEVRERVLLPGQVLVEYLVGTHESLVFALTGSGLRVRTIALGADSLRALVDSFRTAVGAEAPNLNELAVRLQELLLAPVELELAATSRLLIVTDGPLVTLPFAALRREEGFLVETHAIACAPSASVLDPSLWPRRHRRSPLLLAVGNPTTYRTAALLDERRGPTSFRFGPLPYAEEEVHQVARHFRRAHTFVGEDATEDAVVGALPQATVVHFATHAWFDPREPWSSGLALAQDEDPAEDGFLQAREILDLRLDADLVVLSACDTGLGKQAGGEGLLGLARAFLQAGARQLVVSLWEIADRSTVGLMDRFHAARTDARAPADLGLQQAQLAMLQAGAPVRDWAAFIVIGRPAAPGDDPSPPLWLVPVLVALVGGPLLLTARARRGPRQQPSS